MEILVNVSENRTSAELFLRIPRLENQDKQLSQVPLSSLVHKVLEERDIVHGINNKAISELCNEIERGASQAQGIIARASPAKHHMPSTWIFAPKIRVIDTQFQPRIQSKDQPINLSSGSRDSLALLDTPVDYREIRSYLVVQKDELLAIRRPEIPGEFGTDVNGQMIPYTSLDIPIFEPGENIYEKDGRLYAGVSGKFSYDTKTFWIETKIVISGDLDYHYGNIRFPGDLEIKGEIRDKFKVWIGGSLYAHHTIDVHQIMVGGEVVAKEGLTGRKQGLLRSKSSISARYIDNCSVECLGPIKVERSIFASNVMCRGEILLPKGKIIGGTTKALNLIDVMELGNNAETPTEIILGLDFVIERQVQECSEKQQKIVRERRDLLTRFKAGGINKPNFDIRIQRLAQEEERTNQLLIDKLPLLDVNDTAILRIRGKIYPGVKIRMCSLQTLVEKNMSGVEFFIDKNFGVIRHRSIQSKK